MRKFRIALAAFFFLGISLLFFGIGLDWFGWMAKIQFLPSVMRTIGAATAVNIGIVALLMLFPLLVGRLYCSTVCPLGVMQDIVIWFRRINGKAQTRMKLKVGQKMPDFKPHVKHFTYSSEHKILRRAILALTVVAIVTGLQTFVVLVAPYSTFGRILGFSIAGTVELIIFFILAWNWGRIWCNAVCPVGTILGLPARVALVRPRIDPSKCTHCGRCERACKSSCIDAANMKIDASRCVSCYDCVGRCKEGAMSLLPIGARKQPGELEAACEMKHPGEMKGAGELEAAGEMKGAGEMRPDAVEKEGALAQDEGRREFLKQAGMLSLALAIPGTVIAENADEGAAKKKAPKVPKTDPVRTRPIVPPGAKSPADFYAHCTACRLCIEACPNGVLRQSKSLKTLFQPEMSFLEGSCDPGCTVCSDLCPSGALRQFVPSDRPKVGIATVNTDLCLAASKGAKCGRCSSKCPAEAVEMKIVDGVRMPVVDPSLCIGCGACENACPVRPVSAIIIEGLD